MEFLKAVNIILKLEGPPSNNPKDPGGETRFGISKKAYPNLDIATLSQDDAIKLYEKDYWDRCHCAELPPVIRLIVFDCSVNQGVEAAIKMLQACLNLSQSGNMDVNTIYASNNFDPEALLVKFSNQRLERYWLNPKFSLFGHGWISRLMQITARSGMAQDPNVAISL